jgi:hypothetical protein
MDQNDQQCVCGHKLSKHGDQVCDVATCLCEMFKPESEGTPEEIRFFRRTNSVRKR